MKTRRLVRNLFWPTNSSSVAGRIVSSDRSSSAFSGSTVRRSSVTGSLPRRARAVCLRQFLQRRTKQGLGGGADAETLRRSNDGAVGLGPAIAEIDEGGDCVSDRTVGRFRRRRSG